MADIPIITTRVPKSSCLLPQVLKIYCFILPNKSCEMNGSVTLKKSVHWKDMMHIWDAYISIFMGFIVLGLCDVMIVTYKFPSYFFCEEQIDLFNKMLINLEIRLTSLETCVEKIKRGTLGTQFLQ